MTMPVLVLLAGGLSRRMGGGDKSLQMLGGRPILAHVVERLAAPAMKMVLNANGNPARFAPFGLPVVPDGIEGFPGPLAGVLAGMRWARANAPEATDVVTVATDTPLVPRDLVPRLVAARDEAGVDLACAASAGRAHPVFCLWPVRLADDLERAVREEAMRKVDRWTARFRLVKVDFDFDPVDPFFNVNTPEDMEQAERLLG